jgi:hypothetical protein
MSSDCSRQPCRARANHKNLPSGRDKRQDCRVSQRRLMKSGVFCVCDKQRVLLCGHGQHQRMAHTCVVYGTSAHAVAETDEHIREVWLMRGDKTSGENIHAPRMSRAQGSFLQAQRLQPPSEQQPLPTAVVLSSPPQVQPLVQTQKPLAERVLQCGTKKSTTKKITTGECCFERHHHHDVRLSVSLCTAPQSHTHVSIQRGRHASTRATIAGPRSLAAQASSAQVHVADSCAHVKHAHTSAHE